MTSLGVVETSDSLPVVEADATNRWDFAILDTIRHGLRGSNIQVGKGQPPAPPRLRRTVKSHAKRVASGSQPGARTAEAQPGSPLT
jgi:hypothetical protein